jgi:hypothetical protein
MSILKTIKSFLGITEKLTFNDSDSDLLVKLQANRDTALRQLIPTRMMNEFMNFIYPDHHLKLIVKDIYHTYHDYLVSEESRRVYLQYALRLSLSIKGFGRSLILHHNIDPEVIVKTMLGDTEIESIEET